MSHSFFKIKLDYVILHVPGFLCFPGLRRTHSLFYLKTAQQLSSSQPHIPLLLPHHIKEGPQSPFPPPSIPYYDHPVFIPSVMPEAWSPFSSSVRAYVHLNHLLTLTNHSLLADWEANITWANILNQKVDGDAFRLEGNYLFKVTTDCFRFYRHN